MACASLEQRLNGDAQMGLQDVHSFSSPGFGWGGVYVPPLGAYSKAPFARSNVGEFEVAMGGGVWVAAGDSPNRRISTGIWSCPLRWAVNDFNPG